MWIFNKQGGPPLIKTVSKTAFAPRPRRPHAL
jgi:hypothetical protein